LCREQKVLYPAVESDHHWPALLQITIIRRAKNACRGYLPADGTYFRI